MKRGFEWGIKVMLALAVFAGAFSLLSLKSEAKGIEELRAELAPYSIEDAQKVVAINEAVDLDGYDFNGYRLWINYNNTTIKNCTNISGIEIASDASGDGVVISNNTIIGNGDAEHDGFNIINATGCKILNNTIKNVSASASIRLVNCKNMEVIGNNITDSKHYGISLLGDDSSTIKGNTVTNSASGTLSKELHGDGILLDDSCKFTKIIENNVDKVKSGFTDYGNGIIVGHDCNGITVEGNTVKKAGNHGIQVTYKSMGVTLKNNKVTESGYVGISISRGASVNTEGNEVYGNIGNGIVYDGNETAYGAVSGMITNNIVRNNTGSGLFIFNCNPATVTGNTIKNNGDTAITVTNGSTVTIKNNTMVDNIGAVDTMGCFYGVKLWTNSTVTFENNKLYLSSRNEAGLGISVSSGTDVTINDNAIANYAYLALSAASDARATVTNNKAATEGGGFSLADAFWIPGPSGALATGNVTLANTAKSEVIPAELSPEQLALIEAFVRRIYTDCLERPADESGVAYWVNELANGRKNGAEVGSLFVFSDEYAEKKTTKQEYIKMLYKVFMGRTYDEGGLKYWMKQMRNGKTREEVFKGFVESGEYTEICESYGIPCGNYSLSGKQDPESVNGTVTPEITAFVERIYEKALNRSSDPGGLDFWTKAIANEEWNPIKVASYYIISPEFESLNVSDEEYVLRLYRTFMGREPDAGGYAYWLGEMETQSRERILERFAGCDEFQDIMDSFGV